MFHDLHLKTDVLVLADVFEKFISICIEYYGLDPCHYFSSPVFSWDVMLKMTKIELELLSDIDMYLFIDKGIIGGISYIAKGYSKVNNKYMQSYDDKNPSKYITYVDENSLYGWAIDQNLPYGGFKWLNQKEIYKSDVNSIGENSSVGCE